MLQLIRTAELLIFSGLLVATAALEWRSILQIGLILFVDGCHALVRMAGG